MTDDTDWKTRIPGTLRLAPKPKPTEAEQLRPSASNVAGTPLEAQAEMTALGERMGQLRQMVEEPEVRQAMNAKMLADAVRARGAQLKLQRMGAMPNGKAAD